jgi:putative transposase
MAWRCIITCVSFETVRYTYRLRPGAQAERALTAEWHRCRWLWNEAVHQQKTGRKPTICKLSRLLTEARGRSAWLREGSQVAQQQALRAYMAALDASFKIPGRGRPKVKKRKVARLSLEYTTRGFTLRGGRLCLPKGVTVPVVWSRPLPSEPTSVRVFGDNLGHWYASFVVRRDPGLVPEAAAAIGIDWGVITTATTTGPAYDLPYGGYRKRCAAELARAQRKMARRARRRGRRLHGPQSRRYRDAERQAARIAKKAARQNTHAARLWARRVVDDHQLIAIEDFRPKFLGRSPMARKAADAAIGAAKRELIERGGAGWPEGGAGPARLHDNDLLGVWRETSAPRAGPAHLPVRVLRVHRRSEPERRKGDPRHGRTRPCRCRRHKPFPPASFPAAGWCAV